MLYLLCFGFIMRQRTGSRLFIGFFLSLDFFFVLQRLDFIYLLILNSFFWGFNIISKLIYLSLPKLIIICYIKKTTNDLLIWYYIKQSSALKKISKLLIRYIIIHDLQLSRKLAILLVSFLPLLRWKSSI